MDTDDERWGSRVKVRLTKEILEGKARKKIQRKEEGRLNIKMDITVTGKKKREEKT